MVTPRDAVLPVEVLRAQHDRRALFGHREDDLHSAADAAIAVRAGERGGVGLPSVPLNISRLRREDDSRQRLPPAKKIATASGATTKAIPLITKMPGFSQMRVDAMLRSSERLVTRADSRSPTHPR